MIELFIDSDEPLVNGEIIKIDVPAYIIDGRTMVPLRFISESTGAIVTWHSDTYEVSISTDNEISIDKTLSYPIVDTGQTTFFTGSQMLSSIDVGDDFYGQDANYEGNQPSYTDNGDGTITDEVTGLMWQQSMDEKMSFEYALIYANESKLAGYDDWRLPNIKELFSLMMFYGESSGDSASVLFIDTDYFDQPIGDTSIGEREIDAQVWSSTEYVHETMHGDHTVFGVNFIDGRIKGYPTYLKKEKQDNTMYVRLVRGNDYGDNIFIDNEDGTISDLATGLMWQMTDDGNTRDWQEALEYAENLELSGYDDWRLPNIKELQSIVDYTKSPETTDSPAIDDLFMLTEDEGYGFYWSSTSHMDGMNLSDSASYVAFGKALGQMNGDILDVHGAGAVRSDPKSGDILDYPQYFGPQGDIRYVYNYVLAVREETD